MSDVVCHIVTAYQIQFIEEKQCRERERETKHTLWLYHTRICMHLMTPSPAHNHTHTLKSENRFRWGKGSYCIYVYYRTISFLCHLIWSSCWHQCRTASKWLLLLCHRPSIIISNWTFNLSMTVSSSNSESKKKIKNCANKTISANKQIQIEYAKQCKRQKKNTYTTTTMEIWLIENGQRWSCARISCTTFIYAMCIFEIVRLQFSEKQDFFFLHKERNNYLAK